MSRLDELLKILNEDPNDPFTLYAIATEYLNIDLIEARKHYEYLLQNHPNYIPTYYHISYTRIWMNTIWPFKPIKKE